MAVTEPARTRHSRPGEPAAAAGTRPRPARLPSLTCLLAACALLLATVLAGGCAASRSPALHVIGVYKGTTPAGVDNRSRRENCLAAQDTQPRHSHSECQAQFDRGRLEKEVIVNVEDDTRPLVLAFTAYEPTLWKLRLKAHVRLEKVVLAGYHAQRVTGLPPSTPIEAYTYDPSPCTRCWQSDRYFYSADRAPPQLREITGLEVTSFQGRHEGTRFTILPAGSAPIPDSAGKLQPDTAPREIPDRITPYPEPVGVQVR